MLSLETKVVATQETSTKRTNSNTTLTNNTCFFFLRGISKGNFIFINFLSTPLLLPVFDHFTIAEKLVPCQKHLITMLLTHANINTTQTKTFFRCVRFQNLTQF